MAEKNKTLELRNQMKKRKYNFVVKESKFAAGVKKKWKYPRGKHSKVRQMHRGRPALPTPGYGSPQEVKGLHSSGLKFNLVANLTDLEGLNSKVDGVVISRNVGKRKKVDLINKVLEKGFTIINLKDAQKTVKDIQTEFEARKKQKKEKLSTKQKKSEEKKKKAEEKKKKEEEEIQETQGVSGHKNSKAVLSEKKSEEKGSKKEGGVEKKLETEQKKEEKVEKKEEKEEKKEPVTETKIENKVEETVEKKDIETKEPKEEQPTEEKVKEPEQESVKQEKSVEDKA